MIVLAKGRVVRLRQGRLLAFDTADCLGAIGRTSAQLGPAAAQSVHPCLERLLPLGLAYPGTNPPTVAPKAVKVPRSFDCGAFAVFNLSSIYFDCYGLIGCVIPSSTRCSHSADQGYHSICFKSSPISAFAFWRIASFADFLSTVTSDFPGMESMSHGPR